MYIAADMQSAKPPSIFGKVRENSGAPEGYKLIFGQHAIEAIQEAGLAKLTYKIKPLDRALLNGFKWCVFGPPELRAAIDKFETDGGYSDLSMAEYLAKLHGK
jgi:hypothetical protein